jgi:competence protein ComEC
MPAMGAGSAQLNSTASHDHARPVEPAPAPLVETAPAPAVEPAPRRLAPKPKQVEETFYITRTGKRYHRAGCPSLRYSAFPITRAETEA